MATVHDGRADRPLAQFQGSFGERVFAALAQNLEDFVAMMPPPTCSFLTNTGFETGFTGWTVSGTVNQTSDSYSGNYAASLSGSTCWILESASGITAGRIYDLSFYGKIENGPSSAYVTMRFKNSSNAVLNTTTINVTAPTYALHNISATAPTGAVTVEVFAVKTGSNGRLRVDDFCLVETIPTIGNCVLVQNTGFENGTTNWTISGGTVSVVPDPNTGVSAAQIVSSGAQINQRRAINPNQTYELTAWAKVSATAPTYSEIYLRWLTSSGSIIHTVVQPVLANTTSYKKFSLKGRAPANAVYAEIGATKSGLSSRTLYVDDFCLSLANPLGGSGFSLSCGCSSEMLPNGGFEDLFSPSFSYTLEGKSVAALANNNSTTAKPWRTTTNTDYSFIVRDNPATVNNPEGEYFMWLPNNNDRWYSMVNFTNNLKLVDGEQYNICFYAAAWAGSLNGSDLPDGGVETQLPTVANLGLSYQSGYSVVEAWSVPASPSFTNLSWTRYTYTFTYSSLNPITSFSIGNARSSVGLAVDAVSLTKVNCPTEQSCGPGAITFQRWTGIGGATVSDLVADVNYPNNYNQTGTLTSFQGPVNIADNYGTRVFGYIVAPLTGNYTFNVTSDDASRLYLGTNSNPQNKSMIASVPGWTNITEHTKYAQQTSTTIALTAGTKYYVELLQKEAGGGDHFQVYWRTPASATWTIIPGSSLSPICYPEVCSNGFDDDYDGLTDCNDPDCSSGLVATVAVTDENCGTGGGAIDLTTTSTDVPLSYVWSDMMPTAWWTFEDNTNDVTGNSNHSNGIVGTLLYTKDAIEGEGSIYFNGSSNIRYSVDNGFMEQAFSRLTVSMWLKPATLSGVQTIFDEGGSTSGTGLAIRLTNNNLETRVRGTSNLDLSTTYPSDGLWHHIAVVFNNGAFSLYLDGVLSDSGTAPYTTVGAHGNNGGIASSIGGSVLTGSSGTPYRGHMDDIRYYFGNGLTAAQVADLARNDGDRLNLFAGSYTVTISSAAGCSNTQTIAVNSSSNHTIGGTIVGDESSCAGAFDPSLITSSAPASGGGAGITEYQWQFSTDGGVSWLDVPGQTGSTYDPGSIAATTMFRRGGRLVPCLAWVYSNAITKSIITNFTTSGNISGNEVNCGNYDPTLITSTALPSGGIGGTLEYQWQLSTDSITWADIAGANAATFDPAPISQTTFFRRGAKRSSCASFLYSNTVVKMAVVNFSDPGIIAGVESSCSSFDPDVISSVTVPTGGADGTLQYQWQYSTDYGTSWLDISGAVAETYDPITIIQTTYYRRGARRSPCFGYVYSNSIVKMVVINFTAGGVIAGDQGTCGSYDPFIISTTVLPSGGVDGVFSYQWEASTDFGTTWSNIPGEFGETLDPGNISTTTWYRRQCRRTPCTAWINSNTVVKTVLPMPDVVLASSPDTALYLCEWTSYMFEASDLGVGATYVWDFGSYAIPSTATGIGPHMVVFNVPNGVLSTPATVYLTGTIDGCVDQDTLNFDVRPQISVVSTSLVHPADCEINNGEIFINTSHPAFTNVQASIDGGLTWDDEPLHFDSLYSGNFPILLRYDDSDCEYLWGSVTLIDPISLTAEMHVSQLEGCADDIFVFEAIQVDSQGNAFNWNFGADAMPSTATGLGPHLVTFMTPGSRNVVLSIKENFCTGYVDTMITVVSNFTDGGTIGGSEDLCAAPITAPIPSLSPPSGGLGGTFEYQWQVAEDDGNGGWTAWTDIAGANAATYAPGTIAVSSQYRRGARRSPCSAWVYSNEIYKRLSNLPSPNNDVFTSACPGIIFFDYVYLNDANLSNPVYTVEIAPQNGTVDLDVDGEFVYTPNSFFCGMDVFTYRVCNNGTTCCATATVTIDLGDVSEPVLLNVPSDLTISCDDEMPLPPIVDAWENCHTVTLGMDEGSNQGTLDSCSIYSYELTRTWTASDYCGNSASDNQVINIQDLTSPDIYRIYTLPNGKKMVAGVMENVSHRWKTIRFPVQFSTAPVVFAQVVTENENTAVVTRMRNVSTAQFQLRLQEEEAEDGTHTAESVAWIAIEPGDVTGSLPFEVSSRLASSSLATISFNTPKPTPGFIGAIQTFNENNPANLRINTLSSTQARVFCQEEISFDPEVNHGFERVGFMAVNGAGNMTNQTGEVIGEIGKLDLTSSSVTVNLQHQYHNPVVVFGGITINEVEPSMVRITNLTTTSFTVYMDEWQYLDQAHIAENLTYMVVEGSIPFDREVECSAIPNPPTNGVEIVGMDNCDVSTPLTILDSQFEFDCANDTMFTRVFSVQDECGNFTTLTQIFTLRDTTPPTFSPPADITVTCLTNLNDLPTLGDVVNEDDNCATGIQATYTDDNSNRTGCSGYVIRNWTLVDYCGNTTTHQQIITIYNQNDGDSDGIADPFDLDDDNDGIPDVDEGYGDLDGDGIPNNLDLDTDNDGIPDIIEAGMNDTNGDGIVDSFGEPDWDIDGDGLANEADANDNDPSLAASDDFDPSDTDHDSDGDGIPNFKDLDSDNDGIPDLIEAGGVDTNGDGVIDYPTPGDPTSLQDADGDGFVDTYDPDDDSTFGIDDPGDVLVANDNGVYSGGGPNLGPDTDGDGIPDFIDLDTDNDGIADLIEAGGVDKDGDGRVDDNNFVDVNMNGFHDIYETYTLITTEADGPDNDGLPDDDDGDGSAYNSGDTDSDGIPNHQDTDSDNDGINDIIEVGYGSLDTDLNGRIDNVVDTNRNGFHDGSTGLIFTDGDGTVPDGRPEDNADTNSTPYGSTTADGTFGSNNGQPDLDDDGDGIPNFLDTDSDNDFLNDHLEDVNGNGATDTGETNYLNSDTDGDFILDGTEDSNQNGAYNPGTETDPLNPDTDNDGIPDGTEDSNQNGVVDPATESDPRDPCDPVATPACIGVSLKMNARLSGALVGNGNMPIMLDKLREKGYLPTEEPYSDLSPFNHIGDQGGNEVVSPNIFSVTGPDAIVDWMFVELRSHLNPQQVIGTRSALIQRDGDIVDVDGTSNLKFDSIPSGEYYVALRHRNHLGVGTLIPRLLSPTPTVIDFSSPATDTYGTQEQHWVNGVNAMWMGDLNGDKKVVYQGPFNDITAMFFKVLLDEDNENTLANFIIQGYTQEDVNLDGNTIYQGPGNDRSTLLLNATLVAPLNPNLLTNYIILQQLP